MIRSVSAVACVPPLGTPLGERLDGWTNDDLPTETAPGNADTLQWKGKPIANTPHHRSLADLDYTGSIMPPPEAVAGTYVGPDGKKIKVEPLTDTDRRTIVQWIDLGCPIDLHYNAENPQKETYGWMCDDNRPTVTRTYPKAGVNDSLSRILVGLHDYSGLDLESLEVKADFAIDGMSSGENIAARFKQVNSGIWELRFAQAITELPRGELTVAVRDRQGNRTQLKRTFAVVKPGQ